VPLSRVPMSSLEGCGTAAVQEWVAQCLGVDTGLTSQIPYSARDGRAGRVGGTAPGYDSQAVLEDRRGGDSPFDPGARGVPKHLVGGVGATSRARVGLERGGESPEGAPAPRARCRIARGGARPSSEADCCPRGCQPLERGGESPEGYCGQSVGGPLWFLWAVGLPSLSCDHRQHVFLD
jgi:hypothetical protein